MGGGGTASGVGVKAPYEGSPASRVPSTSKPAAGAGGGGSSVGLSTEYEANRPQQMPVYNSPAQIESARERRRQIMARSGRTSTNLRGNPGTQTYLNSFLGNVA